MKKILLLSSTILTLTGCSYNSYDYKEDISVKENFQTISGDNGDSMEPFTGDYTMGNSIPVSLDTTTRTVYEDDVFSVYMATSIDGYVSMLLCANKRISGEVILKLSSDTEVLSFNFPSFYSEIAYKISFISDSSSIKVTSLDYREENLSKLDFKEIGKGDCKNKLDYSTFKWNSSKKDNYYVLFAKNVLLKFSNHPCLLD